MGRGTVESGLFRSERYQLEQRTSDPATTQEGDMWIRTDLASDTDQIGTLRFDAGGGVVYDIPIYATGASSASVEEAARMQVSATAGFIPVVDFADLTPTFDELRMQHNTTQYGLHDVATIPAVFDVTITNTNSPVTPGTTLSVDYSVNNTGDLQDTEDIRLEIDSVEEDRDSSITLKGGASTTGTLSWDTTNETAADYSATVLSNDDSDSVTVTVESVGSNSGVFYYNYEQEGSASTAVDQWNNNDGTINGASYTTSAHDGSHALSFDGTQDYVSLSSGLFDTSAFSVACWAYPTGVSGARDVLITLKADVDSDIRATTGGPWQFGLYDGSSFNACTANFSANTWQHIACTYDGSTAVIYLDGSQADTVSTGLVTKSTSSYIGATANLSEFYNGRLDETKVYNKALSSTEVSNLYSTGSIY